MTIAQHLSQSVEWYTPEKYIEAARRVLGVIELDPASCELANHVVRARNFFDDDGLELSWYGSVWLNPPYPPKKWVKKLIDEFENREMVDEAILLTNNATEAQWFKPLRKYPKVFTDHRIHFWNDSGVQHNPTHGNCFTYFGHNPLEFYKHFREFGEEL